MKKAITIQKWCCKRGKTGRAFFKDLGYSKVDYTVVEGRMPSAIALISNS